MRSAHKIRICRAGVSITALGPHPNLRRKTSLLRAVCPDRVGKILKAREKKKEQEGYVLRRPAEPLRYEREKVSSVKSAIPRLKARPDIRVRHAQRTAIVLLILDRKPTTVFLVRKDSGGVEALIVDHRSIVSVLAARIAVAASERADGADAVKAGAASSEHDGAAKAAGLVVFPFRDTGGPAAGEEAGLAEDADVALHVSDGEGLAWVVTVCVFVFSSPEEEGGDEDGSDAKEGADDDTGYRAVGEGVSM